MAETPPLKSLKSALKAKEPSAPIKGAPDHDVDFQTVFPGWPRSYFLGILPLASLGAVYHPDGSPSFNCKIQNFSTALNKQHYLMNLSQTLRMRMLLLQHHYQ